MTTSPDTAMLGDTVPAARGRNVRSSVMWGAADQMLFSATSFAMAVGVGRTARLSEFGAFALVYLAYVVALGAAQGFVGDVLVQELPRASAEARQSLIAGASMLALAAGTIAGAFGILAVSLAGGLFTSLGVAVFAPAPLLFVQHIQRFARFGDERPELAFRNDLLWALLEVLGFAFLWWANLVSTRNVVAVWSISGAICGIVAVIAGGCAPRVGAARRWFAQHSGASLRFSAEFTAVFGASQSVVAFVAVWAGLAQTAGYRAGQLVFSPPQVLIDGMRLAVTPMLVKVYLRRGVERLVVGALLVAGLGVLLVVLWTVALVAMPESVGRLAVGVSWNEARPIFWIFGLINCVVAIGIGAIIVLRSLDSLNRGAAVRLGTAALTLTLGAAGAAVDGRTGAALGVAAAATAGTMGLWIQAAVAIRETRSAAEPARRADD